MCLVNLLPPSPLFTQSYYKKYRIYTIDTTSTPATTVVPVLIYTTTTKIATKTTSSRRPTVLLYGLHLPRLDPYSMLKEEEVL